MSEIKLEAGQWYRLLDKRIGFCIGQGPKSGEASYDNYPMLLVFNYAGDVYCWYTISGVSAAEADDNVVEHLPGCTGFDWVPTPKLQLREGAWYERADGKIVGPCEPYKNPSWAPEANWKVACRWYSDDGKNPAPETNLVREVDPPQPPQRKYRAFANLKEFLPHRDRFVCINNPNDKYPELYRVNVFNDHTFWLHSTTGHLYARGLHEYRFADVDANGELVFSPFGVLDQ